MNSVWSNHPARTPSALFIGAFLFFLIARFLVACKPATGETYQFVFEVDVPAFLRTLAQNPDAPFDKLMRRLEATATVWDTDRLQHEDQKADVDLSRYFGSSARIDSETIAGLNKALDDAIAGNLRILDSRAKLYGLRNYFISQPSRGQILLQLSGVKDLDRARSVFGKTGVLEFKLMEEPEIFNALLTQIDSVFKRELNAPKGAPDAGRDVAQAASWEGGITVKELFGDSISAPAYFAWGEKDSIHAVFDPMAFWRRPFLSLLVAVGADPAALVENYEAVEQILAHEQIQSLLPPGALIHWSEKTESFGDREYRRLYLIKKAAILTGANLTGATASVADPLSFSSQREAMVNIAFDEAGAKIFSQATEANIGKRLAIVLDGKVMLAPRLNERIPHGKAELRGNLTPKEAQALAIVLRSGALHIPMRIIETKLLEAR